MDPFRCLNCVCRQVLLFGKAMFGDRSHVFLNPENKYATCISGTYYIYILMVFFNITYIRCLWQYSKLQIVTILFCYFKH